MKKTSKTIKIYQLSEIPSFKIAINKPLLIFLKGDLGSGKTTLSQHILSKILNIREPITSPTYTYYNKYSNNYHFDLYRLSKYEDFFAVGGEEILDNNQGVILIEWPEIIEKYYSPDIIIHLQKTQKINERSIIIETYL